MYTGLTAEALLEGIATQRAHADWPDAALELAWRIRLRDRDRSQELVRAATLARGTDAGPVRVFALRATPPASAAEVLELAGGPAMDPLWSLRALAVGVDRLVDRLTPQETGELVRAARDVMAQADGLVGPGDLQVVQNMLGRVRMMSPDSRPEALEHFQRAAELSELADEDAAQAINLVNAASVLGMLDDPAGALESYLRALEVHARGATQPRVLSFIHGNIAILYWRMGGLEEALHHAGQAIDVGRRSTQLFLVLHSLAARARVFLTLGDLESADDDLEELATTAARSEDGRGHLQVARTLRALWHVLGGSPDRALASLEETDEPEHEEGILERTRVRIRALTRLGRAAEAVACAESVPGVVLQVRDPLYDVVVDDHVANLRALGRQSEAIDVLLERTHFLRQRPRQIARHRMQALTRDVAVRTARARADDASDQARRLQQSLQRAQRLESFGQLAAGLAHDFNNALTIVSAAADSLEQDTTAAERRESLATLHRAVDQATSLTRRLLAVARQSDLDLARVDLARHLAEARPILQAAAERHGLALDIDAHAVAQVDPQLLDQALLNLIINARDAMEEQGTITVSLHGGRRRVRVSVTDTGSGIAQADLQRVFDPFFSTKGDAGTGLGLAMVWGIAQQLGGDVSVESEVGVGTTFTLELPALVERQAG